ncbi:thiamine-phosphate synthase family protein [Halovenus marina]|uniref:thiamine-phosphate synthase family protein n=1 Tax=Halovenus marina TaxID=3396621 RepID=UPI003F5739E3
MKFIEEIVVEEFLPTVRSLLAESLRARGLTQSDVAELLGISQSAVSKYATGDVDRNERLLADERVQDLVDRLSEGLTTGEMSPTEALIEIEVCIRELERGGALAELHAEAVPDLAEYDGELAVHDPDSRLREAGRVRSSVRRGLRILRNTDGFAGEIPAVGSNLVECLSDAETVEDVVAVPGRILAIRGQVTIPGEPEFGVSQHVASVLLAARRHGSDARAVVNLRYDEATLDSLRDDYVLAEFDADADLDEAIAAALADQQDADVLYQSGGFGIEPIIYVLGPDAPTVAEIVREHV